MTVKNFYRMDLIILDTVGKSNKNLQKAVKIL